MQKFENNEENNTKIQKTPPSSDSSSSINKCIDQVFKKNKYRGKYVKISNEKKNILKDWLAKNPHPSKNDLTNISKILGEPTENVEKWYRNQKKTNKTIKKGLPKTKKILTKAEEEILEKAFRNNIKPKPEKYRELSKKVSISSKQIRKWFKYRRRKLNRLFNDRINLRSSQMKGKPIDSSESSYKTSNSSPNLSTNDLKSQKNNSSSVSNQLQQPKDKNPNNKQENTQNQMPEPEDNSNIQGGNNKNAPNNFNNIYQNNMMNQNYQHMIFTYPLAQSNLEATQQAIPIVARNNSFQIIPNSVPPVVYLSNPPQQYYFANNGYQQAPVLIKNIPLNNVNRANPNHFLVMNNINPYRNDLNSTTDMIKIPNENFESMSSDKNQGYCFVNQSSQTLQPLQISNNNQNLFNNIIYLKQNNDAPNFIPNQNLMPPLSLIQNLQILHPQNSQGFCYNGPGNYAPTPNYSSANFQNIQNNAGFQIAGYNNRGPNNAKDDRNLEE